MKVSDLSLEQKIGQKIIIGFRGTELQSEPLIVKYLEQGFIGGVILFDKDLQTKSKRNIVSPEQLRKLTDDIRSRSKIKPFIAVDQEGGAVARLNSTNGYEDYPSHNELSKTRDKNYAREISRKMAGMLKKSGINLNFAPVLDLAINPDNQVVVQKGRCFSDKWDIVADFASEFIQAHLDEDVLPVGKHFPGHGSSLGDTHNGWVDITTSWRTEELKPYEAMIQRNLLPAVMVGHLYNKNVDPIYPSSLSHIWIEEVLRKNLSFKGIVFTDDLQMKAISSHFTLEEMVELSFNAGVDVLVFANQLEYNPELPERIIELSLRMISDGKFSIKAIDSSVERILEIKEKLC
jgi:beta-N-acetylhexosaminidase